MGNLPDTLPIFLYGLMYSQLRNLVDHFPLYRWTFSVVGLLESMMTATIVDDLTDTSSDKNRSHKGKTRASFLKLLGYGDLCTIGQSMINIKSGGRGRLSTLSAGVFLLIMVVSWPIFQNESYSTGCCDDHGRDRDLHPGLYSRSKEAPAIY